MYLDANFFVFVNLADDAQGERARIILSEITKNKKAITSSLAIDEMMWAFLKKQAHEEIRQAVEDVYATKNLEVKEVPALIPLRALDFMEKHRLKPRDAFHVSLMEHFGER